MQPNNSLVDDIYTAIAIESGSELEKLILSRASKSFYSRGDNARFDLFPFYSILVSTGINKNTDAFDPVELWRARHSPADKPVNIGHKQTRIIGHIIDNIVVDEDLKPIPEDTKEGDLPYKLHVITAAVIYKIWEDPAVQAEINSLIEKISKGEIFVSMECLFRDFAYLLTNASGEQKVIERTPETASLTKYLRQYKGPGKIYNYSLARLLKNITFSAVGIVENPANANSIISKKLDLFSSSAIETENDLVYINLDCKQDREKIMAELNIKDDPQYKSLQEQYDLLKRDHQFVHTSASDLKIELENTKTALAVSQQELKTMADTVKSEEDAETEMASIKTTVATLEDQIKTLKATVSTLEAGKAELATANEAMTATLDAFKKASRHSKRAEAMMGADATLTLKAALQAVAKFDELSDAGFAGMVEMFKGYAGKAPKEVTPETILDDAKAEEVAPMGTLPEATLNKTAADIKNFLSYKKVSPKE